jgi:ubiquinone/menaquinone biosynthesis C-methylase UbiE
MAPYVPSPQQIVDKMLESAALKAGETLYDLGSGDGRVLITAVQKYRVKAVGVEISDDLVKSTGEQIRKLNLQDLITVIHADMMTVNLSPADVVTLYLETGSNDKLRPNMERDLKAGARVVSHDFQVPGWKVTRIEKIDFYNRPHRIYIYEMPAKK